jgi:hypothetical protein
VAWLESGEGYFAITVVGELFLLWNFRIADGEAVMVKLDSSLLCRAR